MDRALRDARRRIEWLEDELADQLVSECRSIPTGTSLRGLWKHKRGSEPTEAPSAPRGSAQLCEADAEKSTDSSLLVLNATGDVRYLGPSSGVLFANYATALASSCGEAQGRVPRASLTGFRDNVSMRRAEEQKHLSAQEIRLLVQSYKLWVHPLYPLFTSEALENLVALCSPLQLTSDARNHPQDMCLFYLILALGATNYANTTKHICLGVDAKLSDNAASHTGLYSMALQHFQVSVEQRLPNVMFVQALLLICIYGSYGVTGSSQWQLAGLAMRVSSWRRALRLHADRSDGDGNRTALRTQRLPRFRCRGNAEPHVLDCVRYGDQLGVQPGTAAVHWRRAHHHSVTCRIE